MDEKRKSFLKENFSLGFTKFIGMEPLEISAGKFESRMVITENHRQQDGFVHAGAVSTLADHTAGYAAFTLAGEGMQILTIEFKINFLAPASGDCLIC
ncbi:MAG: PaaI family thioesterase, partial [Desulfatibacillum sp.]|nr:PaaI family thioesterase [Desulfatibacillum sp.]